MFYMLCVIVLLCFCAILSFNIRTDCKARPLLRKFNLKLEAYKVLKKDSTKTYLTEKPCNTLVGNPTYYTYVFIIKIVFYAIH